MIYNLKTIGHKAARERDIDYRKFIFCLTSSVYENLYLPRNEKSFSKRYQSSLKNGIDAGCFAAIMLQQPKRKSRKRKRKVRRHRKEQRRNLSKSFQTRSAIITLLNLFLFFSFLKFFDKQLS